MVNNIVAVGDNNFFNQISQPRLIQFQGLVRVVRIEERNEVQPIPLVLRQAFEQ